MADPIGGTVTVSQADLERVLGSFLIQVIALKSENASLKAALALATHPQAMMRELKQDAK